MDGYRIQDPKGPVRIRVVTPRSKQCSISGGDSSVVEHLTRQRVSVFTNTSVRGPEMDGYHNQSVPGSNPGRHPSTFSRSVPTKRGHQPLERLDPSFTFARSRAAEGRLSGSIPDAPTCSLGSTEERRYHKPEATVRLGQGVPMLG